MRVRWHKPKVLWRFVRYVYKSFRQHEGLENAKSLTFTSLFAVVPLLTLTVTMLSAFPAFQGFGSQVQEMLFNRLLPSSSAELQQYIQSFSEQARNLTWAGALILMATAYFMLVSIEENFNAIWGVGQSRRGMASFLLYWSVLSLSPLLLGAGFAITSYITSLSMFEAFTSVSESVGVNNIALTLFPLLLTALAFTLLYVAVPNCAVKVVHGLVGGLVVALSFSIVRNLFTWAMSMASYAIVYGTFAALPIFLIWLYLCWVVILFGANLVRSIPAFRELNTEYKVHRTLLMLALLHNLWQKHQRAESLCVSELVDEQWPFQDVDIEKCLDLLIERHMVRMLNEEEYILTQDLHATSVWGFIRSLPWALPGPDELETELPEMLRPHLPDYESWKAKIAELEAQGLASFHLTVDEYFRHETL